MVIPKDQRIPKLLKLHFLSTLRSKNRASLLSIFYVFRGVSKVPPQQRLPVGQAAEHSHAGARPVPYRPGPSPPVPERDKQGRTQEGS